MKRKIYSFIAVFMMLLVACTKEPAVTTAAVHPHATPTTATPPTSPPTVAPTATSEPTATATPTAEPTIAPTATTNPCGNEVGKIYWDCPDKKLTLDFWIAPEAVEVTKIDSETYEFVYTQKLYGSVVEGSDFVNRSNQVTVRAHTENREGQFSLPSVEFGRAYGTWLLDVTFGEVGVHYGIYNTTFSNRFYAVLREGELVAITHQYSFDEPAKIEFFTVENGVLYWLTGDPKSMELGFKAKNVGIGVVQAHEGGTMNAIEDFDGGFNQGTLLPRDVEINVGYTYRLREVLIKSVGGTIVPNE